VSRIRRYLANALSVAGTLTSTSLTIMQLPSERRLDITETVTGLQPSQPYARWQIIKLEETKLVRVGCERAKKGTKKLRELNVEKMIIRVKP